MTYELSRWVILLPVTSKLKLSIEVAAEAANADVENTSPITGKGCISLFSSESSLLRSNFSVSKTMLSTQSHCVLVCLICQFRLYEKIVHLDKKPRQAHNRKLIPTVKFCLS